MDLLGLDFGAGMDMFKHVVMLSWRYIHRYLLFFSVNHIEAKCSFHKTLIFIILFGNEELIVQ